MIALKLSIHFFSFMSKIIVHANIVCSPKGNKCFTRFFPKIMNKGAFLTIKRRLLSKKHWASNRD